jgi:hypothetical protein
MGRYNRHFALSFLRRNGRVVWIDPDKFRRSHPNGCGKFENTKSACSRRVASLASINLLQAATKIILVPRPGICPDSFQPVGSNSAILVGYSRAERSAFEKIWSSAGGDAASIASTNPDWIGTHPNVCVRSPLSGAG